MGIIENLPSGLVGASIGVIISGIVQYRVYRKQVRIDQQIIAGTRLLENVKQYHYLLAKIATKHSGFDKELKFNKHKIEVLTLQNECMNAISEIVMLRRIYSPVINIPDETTMRIFNETDFYFNSILDHAFIQKENAYEILKLKIELLQALNNTLIYDIQQSMYLSISSKRKMKKKQNESIIKPIIYKYNGEA